jgi:hypothetical protein
LPYGFAILSLDTGIFHFLLSSPSSSLICCDPSVALDVKLFLTEVSVRLAVSLLFYYSLLNNPAARLSPSQVLSGAQKHVKACDKFVKISQYPNTTRLHPTV